MVISRLGRWVSGSLDIGLPPFLPVAFRAAGREALDAPLLLCMVATTAVPRGLLYLCSAVLALSGYVVFMAYVISAPLRRKSWYASW